MRTSPNPGHRLTPFEASLMNEERARRGGAPVLWGGGVPIGGAPATAAATTLELRVLPLIVPEPITPEAFVVAVTAVAGVVRLRAALWLDLYAPPYEQLQRTAARSQIVTVGGTGLVFLPLAEAFKEPLAPGIYHVGVVATIAGGGALALRALQSPAGGFSRTLVTFSTLPESLRWQDLAPAAGFAVGLCTSQGQRLMEGA